MTSEELSPQQKRFVEEYLFDRVATKAAARAGYSMETAASQSSRLMRMPKIKEAIEQATGEKLQKAGITVERVLQELANIGFSNIKDYMTQGEDGETLIDLNAIDRDAAAALSEIFVETVKGKTVVRKVKVKPYNKLDALEKLGKHLGMFKEQVEHTGTLTLEQLVQDSMKKEETQTNE